jgi:hypothetical protein
VLSNAFTSPGVNDLGVHLLNPNLPLANIETPKERTQVPIDPKLLDRYTGRYRLGQGALEITHDGGRLFGQVLAEVNGKAIAGPKFELFAESEKKFFARVTNMQVSFETGPEGRATSLVMQRVGREPMSASRLT